VRDPEPGEVLGAHRRPRLHLDADHAAVSGLDHCIDLDAVLGAVVVQPTQFIGPCELPRELHHDEVLDHLPGCASRLAKSIRVLADEVTRETCVDKV
jgi:hypothetical protein